MSLNKYMDLYLKLEKEMMALDDQGAPLADKVRDLMTCIWITFTKEDRAFLNNRGVMGVSFERFP
jgi:hypothetical protein